MIFNFILNCVLLFSQQRAGFSTSSLESNGWESSSAAPTS
jgi:hypothetical protein